MADVIGKVIDARRTFERIQARHKYMKNFSSHLVDLFIEGNWEQYGYLLSQVPEEIEQELGEYIEEAFNARKQEDT